jgi:hypothetical protein
MAALVHARLGLTALLGCAAIAAAIATAAAGASSSSGCSPLRSTISGHRAIAYCGPATVVVQIAGASYRFHNGICDRSAMMGGLELNVGTLVQGAAGNAGRPFVGLLIAQPPSESEAFEADTGGRQLFGDTVVAPGGTLLSKGAFTSLYGTAFSGSWNCHGVIHAGP